MVRVGPSLSAELGAQLEPNMFFYLPHLGLSAISVVL